MFGDSRYPSRGKYIPLHRISKRSTDYQTALTVRQMHSPGNWSSVWR